MLEPPSNHLSIRTRRISPYRSPSRENGPNSSIQVFPSKSTTSSVASATTCTRKKSMTSGPCKMQRSVSEGPSRRSFPRGVSARGRKHLSRDPPLNPASISRRGQPQLPNQSPIRPSMSRESTASSAWHDERLQKGQNHSSTFQKRLEEQAAAAIQKAEEKLFMEYEKKLQK